MIFISVLLILFTLSTSGCNPNGLDDLASKNCGFDGTWVACGSDGINSQRITLSINGKNLTEAIENFTGSTDCTGSGTVDATFSGAVTLGSQGESTKIPGATDATLVPTSDIGCGAGNPSYTSLMFSDSCEEFIQASDLPACSSANVSTSLGTLIFIKQ